MKADFAMAIHFHQPVGNFDHVIEHACDKCYIPFLKTLKKYPEIKMTFHFTGCLLEWIERKKPEIIDMVRDMVSNGRVEIMGGGFYEPILPSIPPRDGLRQINMLSEYVREKFCFDPKGAWISERVWEPTLPSVLNDAGIKYTVLDDTHFIYSGISKDDIYGYYITEDNAKPVAVFPSDKVLRYYIPYKMPEECISYMKGVADNSDNPVFVYGDDGEKFGEWPGTHKWVFKEKWLEKFFDELMQNSKWLSTVTLSECLKKRVPLGKVYLSSTSYEEMLEWALPADRQEQLEDVIKDMQVSGKEEFYKSFIRGGFWRNFLSKYPEADHMNKKMIYVSKKLEDLRVSRKIKSADLIKAERELFKGQCNCAYWHGVFGGLYLFHLRRAIYYHLIKSEVIMDKALHGKKAFCKVNVLDIDADGADEVILENRELSLYFDPNEGGVLNEIDSKHFGYNLINSLARRKEAYHRKVLEKLEPADNTDSDEVKTIHDGIHAANKEMKDNLYYDWYKRYSLVDHFFGKDIGINAFSRCDYKEAGDFVNGVYTFEAESSKRDAVLVMKREGIVEGIKVLLVKKITLPGKDASFSVQYKISNIDDKPVHSVFAPEFNLTMPDADSDSYSLILKPDDSFNRLGSIVQCDHVQNVEILDASRGLSFNMSFSEEVPFWFFPIKTVSQSEKAYELNYQSSVLLPRVTLELEAGKEKVFGIEFEVI